MAYALGFPKDVTDNIYSMRDWRWEMVRDGGKTPSSKCFNARPMSCHYEGEQPHVWTYGLPQVGIESDEEDSHYGEIYNTDHRAAWFFDVSISTHDERASRFRSFVLRESGRKPAKFHRLQKQNDDRIKELWWQCEPCQP